MEILESIDKYINSSYYRHALMIDGEWGTGKTYFIKNVLIPHLEKEKLKVCYISLNGKRDTSLISDEISISAIKDKLNINEKFLATSQLGVSFLCSFIENKTSIPIKKIKLKHFQEFFPSFNVIVFDDLERCNCDIGEILGYINEYVEHSEISVIIVANESEIGKIQSESNRELQLLLAANNNIDIKLDEKQRNDPYSGNSEKMYQASSMTPELLEKRRLALFNTSEKYKRIKEKVIGQTIKYIPDLEKVFTRLLESKGLNQSLREQCTCLIPRFITIIDREKHKNIRTFQFFLHQANYFFDSLNDDEIVKFSPLFESILLYTFRSSIRYMKGEDLPIWKEDYGIQVFEYYSLQPDANLMGFRFVDDIIQFEKYSKEEVIDTLNEYLQKAIEEGRLSDDPIQLLNQWWCSKEPEVKAWLEELSKNIKNGQYSIKLFPNIIKIAAELNSNGLFLEDVENVVFSMKEFALQSDINKLLPINKEQLFISEMKPDFRIND